MSNTRTLTLDDALALAAIFERALGGVTVARLIGGGELCVAEALCVVDEQGWVADRATEVRDCSLRVMTRVGCEEDWRIAELLEEYQTGWFVVGYEGCGL